ncbi:hypothetical protein FE257_011649 [Aspergillus nanangensis]|uniref:Uncharacterized protein n=1 Tax=Aspergillus nanangensis TaxID=2582783 RepID=A0AAD4CVB8_ASPNN|nr:hypothetical protein FE257_011649 [Aspergillus nanangensis]
MNTTNYTLEQARCAGHSGMPELPYPNFCAISIWQQELNLTFENDPYTILKTCCPTDQYTYFGDDNCFAYCNATKETQSGLETCLKSPRLRDLLCKGEENSASTIGAMRSLTSYLVLVVAFTALWQL